MANERRTDAIYPDAATLLADPGPRVAKYARLLSNGQLYKWVAGDLSTPDAELVIGHTGGHDGNWLLVPNSGGAVVPGAALTDADATITVAQGSFRRLLGATLSANRILTLGNTGAVRTNEITVTRLDVTANTYTIKDQASAATLAIFPASQQWWARFFFDGTNWLLMAAGQLP